LTSGQFRHKDIALAEPHNVYRRAWRAWRVVELAETPLQESIERAAGTACGPQGGLHLTQPSRLAIDIIAGQGLLLLVGLTGFEPATT
jgi:hypothetical protein